MWRKTYHATVPLRCQAQGLLDYIGCYVHINIYYIPKKSTMADDEAILWLEGQGRPHKAR
jgi:hypothetical protein